MTRLGHRSAFGYVDRDLPEAAGDQSVQAPQNVRLPDRADPAFEKDHQAIVSTGEIHGEAVVLLGLSVDFRTRHRVLVPQLSFDHLHRSRHEIDDEQPSIGPVLVDGHVFACRIEPCEILTLETPEVMLRHGPMAADRVAFMVHVAEVVVEVVLTIHFRVAAFDYGAMRLVPFTFSSDDARKRAPSRDLPHAVSPFAAAVVTGHHST